MLEYYKTLQVPKEIKRSLLLYAVALVIFVLYGILAERRGQDWAYIALFAAISYQQLGLWKNEEFESRKEWIKFALAPQALFLVAYFPLSLIFSRFASISKMAFVIVALTVAFYVLLIWFRNKYPSTPQAFYDSGYGTIKTAGSMLNPRNLIKGQRWTTPEFLREWAAQPEKTVFIDEFTYYPETKHALGLKQDEIHENEKVEIRFKPLDFTKTVLMLGKMGSGKTETIINIARQKQFNRLFVNCVKDDLMQALYTDGDIIFSPYSANGWSWDIWAEMDDNEAVAFAFFKNLLTSQTGKGENADFWSNRASQIINEIALRVWHTKSSDNATAAQKWHNLAAELKLKIAAMEKEGTTQAGLAATMQVGCDIIYLMAWTAQKPTTKFFTLKGYFEGEKNLFMLNNQAYSQTLTPLFAGFTAAATSILLGRPDTKTNLTLLILDEYFSLAMDMDTQTALLTMARSKGGCIILAAQMLPKDNKKQQQLIDSSRYALFVFAISDSETVKHICDMFTEIEYTRQENSVSGGSNDGSSSQSFGTKRSSSSGTSSGYNISIKENKGRLLTPELLNAQMPPYHHLTICQDDDLLYLGYTPLAEYTPANVAFEKVNTMELYEYIGGLK